MVNSRIVLQQLKADLIGKDSHRGITLTYAWMANQFGHFSLGFIPVIITHYFLASTHYFENTVFMSTILVSSFWLVFEIYNFLWPLLADKILGKRADKVFSPAWLNIAFDTFTDLLFFWIGAFFASFFIEFQLFNYYAFIILLLLVAYPSMYWYKTKLYQECANYPFQYRLGQWRNTLSTKDKKTVEQYLLKDNEGNHLLVFGSKKSGKTTLSVAIANELSIQHHSCFYTTSMKLFSIFFNEDRDRSREAWDWKQSEYLIIDDINPGGEITDELVQVDEFKKYMTAKGQHTDNSDVIKKKNVIWVLGNYEVNDQGAQWKSFLQEIGVSSDKIWSLNLNSES